MLCATMPAIKVPLYFITRESGRNSGFLFHFLAAAANRSGDSRVSQKATAVANFSRDFTHPRTGIMFATVSACGIKRNCKPRRIYESRKRFSPSLTVMRCTDNQRQIARLRGTASRGMIIQRSISENRTRRMRIGNVI